MLLPAHVRSRLRLLGDAGRAWHAELPAVVDELARRWSVDVGAQVAHGAVRAYVMGERGAKNEPADPDDIEQMATIVQQAVEAGALGVSTSRTIAHTAMAAANGHETRRSRARFDPR